MRFQRSKVATALAYAFGAGGVLTASTGPVFAQTAATSEKITITGSRIPTIQGETSLPVQVITAAEIQREGIQSAAALVERLAANSTTGGITMSATEGNTGAGQSSASLRGLGSTRTLVLMNGRRLAVSGFSGGAVDINAIPLSAIDRVEVLTTGASAIYGSDAIAGVINFIMKSTFQGVEGTAYYGAPTSGGSSGSVKRFSGTIGWGDLATDKFNVFGTVSYNSLDGMAASERKFSATSYIPNLGVDKTSGRSVPANVSTPTGSKNPFVPQCAPPFSFVTTNPDQCRFDYAATIDILPPQQMLNTLGKATWQFNANTQFYLEGLYGKSKVQSAVSPTPVDPTAVFNPQLQPLLLPPSSPFYPHDFAAANGIDGQPLALNWRSVVAGPRREDDEAKQSRVAAGVKGTGWDWDYDATFVWNQNKSDAAYTGGWLKQSLLYPLMATGKLNPFSVSLPPDQLALLDATQFRDNIIKSKAQTTGVDFQASRDIWTLPGGPVSLATGADYFHNTYVFTVNPFLSTGDVIGSGGTLASVPSVSRNNWDVFAEFNIPVLKGLELNAAIRYDHYENIGNTWNPNFSVRWTPVKEVLVRGNWGKGFRAPGLAELYAPGSVSATGGNYTDPQRCPVTNAVEDCNVQFNDLIGGNVALKPEKSTSWGGGAVWEPVPGNSIGVDYWSVKVTNVIGVLGEQNLYGETGEKIPDSVAKGLILRNPQTPQDIALGIPGAILYALQTNLNIQALKVQGLDFAVKLRAPASEWGQFSFAGVATYYLSWKQTDLETGKLVDYAGKSVGGIATTTSGPGFPASLPKWKSNAALNWNYGPWASTLTNVYQNGYEDDSGTRRVGSYSLWDLTASYSGFKNVTLMAGLKNMFDRNPPASDQAEAFQVGYDPTYADPRGRFLFGSIRVAFQ